MSSSAIPNINRTYSSHSYSRISIHLPAAKAIEKTAAAYFIAKMSEKYDCTYSDEQDPVFTGKWVDKSMLVASDLSNLKHENATAIDRLSILFVDVPKETEKLKYDEEVADNLSSEAERIYAFLGASQKSFWVYISKIMVRELDSSEISIKKADLKRI